jgi:hypothetical protein
MNSTSHVAISSGAESNQKPKLGDSAISMTLNGTKFCLNSEGRWEIESTDLNLATLEIERLLDEKEQLCIALSRAMQQIADLQQEVRDLNNIKSTTLEMVSSLIPFSFIAVVLTF